jgi:hypothetical protein
MNRDYKIGVTGDYNIKIPFRNYVKGEIIDVIGDKYEVINTGNIVVYLARLR